METSAARADNLPQKCSLVVCMLMFVARVLGLDLIALQIAFATSTQDCGNVTNVKMKPGPRKWPAGYQPDLVCCLTWVDGEPPANVTSISINSSYGL